MWREALPQSITASTTQRAGFLLYKCYHWQDLGQSTSVQKTCQGVFRPPKNTPLTLNIGCTLFFLIKIQQGRNTTWNTDDLFLSLLTSVDSLWYKI
jgi:hypothetical protein